MAPLSHAYGPGARPGQEPPSVRPPPARRGQPASQRDFERSSAGGAASHLGFALTSTATATATALGNPRTPVERDDRTALSDVQQRKQRSWRDTYVRPSLLRPLVEG